MRRTTATLVVAVLAMATTGASGQNGAQPVPAPQLPVTPSQPTGSDRANALGGSTSDRLPGQGMLQNEKGSDQVSQQDRDFLVQAIRLSEAQVRTARAAIAGSKDVRVQTYAKKALAAGEGMLGSLQRLGRTLKVPVPSDGKQASAQLAKLRETQGNGFDGLYAQLEHQTLQSMSELYAKEAADGENRQVRAFANMGKQRIPVLMEQAEQVTRSTGGQKDPRCSAQSGAAGCP